MRSGELNPGDSPQRSQAEQNHHCGSRPVPVFTEGSLEATDSMAMGMEWHLWPLQQPFEVRTATSNIFLAMKLKHGISSHLPNMSRLPDQ